MSRHRKARQIRSGCELAALWVALIAVAVTAGWVVGSYVIPPLYSSVQGPSVQKPSPTPKPEPTKTKTTKHKKSKDTQRKDESS